MHSFGRAVHSRSLRAWHSSPQGRPLTTCVQREATASSSHFSSSTPSKLGMVLSPTSTPIASAAGVPLPPTPIAATSPEMAFCFPTRPSGVGSAAGCEAADLVRFPAPLSRLGRIPENLSHVCPNSGPARPSLSESRQVRARQTEVYCAQTSFLKLPHSLSQVALPATRRSHEATRALAVALPSSGGSGSTGSSLAAPQMPDSDSAPWAVSSSSHRSRRQSPGFCRQSCPFRSLQLAPQPALFSIRRRCQISTISTSDRGTEPRPPAAPPGG
mmetsp:Transcript_24317/g.57960  ORF Transcript_24317/g.57960 Transcript_24317/m.57960 type:complete len:272 (-) Transcript_24317:566-1381(-)